MQNPSVDEILSFMAKKLGGQENIPNAIRYAKVCAPELIYHVAFSSKNSVGDENSPFDEKTRTLIFLAVALAMKDTECIKTQLNAALTLGATKEELIAIIKIVKHAAHSSVIGFAEPILESLSR
jgi:alkylhydroperoxidase/carboxymuconolactone decarboxylase family protein YurZ